MRKLLGGIVAVLVCLGALTSSAHAYRLYGGRWSSFPVYYYIGWSGTYSDQIVAAAGSWESATYSKVKLYRTYDPYNYRIWVGAAHYGYTGWIGITALAPSAYVSPYTGAEIRLNRTWLDGEPLINRQHTSAHEFGHSIGLDHENSVSCVLMNSSGYCAIYPRADDVNGVNALYP